MGDGILSIIDLAFPLQTTTVPRDHGYALYAAICRVLPALHERAWLAIHPLTGTLVAKNMLRVHRSALRLRIPAERVGEVLGLAGRALALEGHTLVPGPPTIYPLVPAPSLDARMVALQLTRIPTRSVEAHKKQLDMDAVAVRYEAELRRQLAKLDIDRAPQLRGRQRLSIGPRVIVGFSVRIDGLDQAASLRLLEQGLGGKRRMGCGIFRPTRRQV